LLQAELLKKLEESHADVVDVMTDVLNQGTLWVINRSSIPHLLQQLTVESTDKSVPTAQNILSYVSKHCPALFTSHAAALQVALVSKHVAHSEVALQALSSLAKFDPDASIKDARVLDKISGFCTNGSVKQAKYAARMLGHSSLGKTRCIAVVEVRRPSFGLKNFAR
jgi:sister-chromatid-cohesion protein PDS5